MAASSSQNVAIVGNNPVLNETSFSRAVQIGGESSAHVTRAGIYLRAFYFLVLLIIAGVFGWSQVTQITVNGQTVMVAPPGMWCLFAITFVAGFATIANFRAAPITGSIYVLAEGALLGMVARFFANDYEGIVTQAVIYTVCIFLVMLVLYSTRILKASQGLMAAIGAAIGGLLLAWMTIWLISLFSPSVAYTFFGPTPIGIGFAVLIVVLAALSLIGNFAFIDAVAESQNTPSYMAWYAAFGLVLTLIWLYLSILRLLALLNRR